MSSHFLRCTSIANSDDARPLGRDIRPQEWFYAVARGRRTGIFLSWTDAITQVEGCPDNTHRKFPTHAQAEAYLRAHGVLHYPSAPSSSYVHDERERDASRADAGDKFHAVVSGARPGIYMSRDGVDRMLAGISCAHVRTLATYAEAETYMKAFHLVFHFLGRDSAGYLIRRARLATEPAISHALLAFCDGSVPGNGNGNGTIGAIACVFPRQPMLNLATVDARATTNTRAEYLAALWALDRASMMDPENDKALYIFTGSETLVRIMAEYVDDWVLNGWTKTNGAPVKNQDLLKVLRNLSSGRRVEWRNVHSEADRGTWKWQWSKLAEDKARAAAAYHQD